jgi:hypothetical protein
VSVICLEGASSVGKSTTSKILERTYGFKRIPEVNELFKRTSNEKPEWYLEKQLERWAMASEISIAGGTAVLDGDPFQPLWYNWIFNDLGFQDIGSVINFYSRAVETQKIRFPNKYFILTAPESELRSRKNRDATRLRSNFELHLRMIKPQLEYFEFINRVHSGLAEIVTADDPMQLACKIYSSDFYNDCDQLKLFENQASFITT